MCDTSSRSQSIFLKKCGCVAHIKNSSLLHNVITGKKIRKSDIEYLVKQKLFSRGKYLCQNCIDSFCNNLDKQPNTSASNKRCGEHCIKEMHQRPAIPVNQKEEKSSDENPLDLLYSNLSKLVVEDVKVLYKSQGLLKDVNYLTSFNAINWSKERPSDLVKFLSSLLNLDPDNIKDAFLIAQIIDNMYGTQNQKLILPLSFQRNLLTYTLSHSRLLVDFSGACLPSGSYSYLNDWLSNIAKEPVKCPPGTIRIVFDNEQRVGKRYRISANNNNVPVSVVTFHFRSAI